MFGLAALALALTTPYSGEVLRRREAVGVGILGASTALLLNAPSAAATSPTGSNGVGASDSLSARESLLASISASSAETEAAVDRLIATVPPPSRTASAPALAGEWRLLWSVKADAFSPLLNLPPLLRPASFQLLGAAAAAEVGDGRISQVLRFPFGPQLVLSSGAIPADDDLTQLEIQPPFRFEVRERLVKSHKARPNRRMCKRKGCKQPSADLWGQHTHTSTNTPHEPKIQARASKNGRDNGLATRPATPGMDESPLTTRTHAPTFCSCVALRSLSLSLSLYIYIYRWRSVMRVRLSWRRAPMLTFGR